MRRGLASCAWSVASRTGQTGSLGIQQQHRAGVLTSQEYSHSQAHCSSTGGTTTLIHTEDAAGAYRGGWCALRDPHTARNAEGRRCSCNGCCRDVAEAAQGSESLTGAASNNRLQRPKLQPSTALGTACGERAASHTLVGAEVAILCGISGTHSHCPTHQGSATVAADRPF